jgi:hypothetical protein
MKSLVLTLALLAISFPVIADDEDINWYRVTANSLLFVDMLQTVEIAKNDNFYEKDNFILGAQPSEREVYQYFILATVIVNVIGETIPEKYSNIFYIATSVVQIKAINQNIQLGVKIRF